MIKFSREKGSAITEYALIAILFAVILGVSIFQISPDIIRKLFVRSVEQNASVSGGTLQMNTLGE